MKTTTIKLHKSTKNSLDKIKKTKESYNDTISRLAAGATENLIKKRLIEGYKQMGKKDLDFLKEWEGASIELQ